MIEEKLLNFMKKRLQVPVVMEEPQKPDDKYVVLEKTGSGRKEYIYTATIVAQSYAKSMYEAAVLNEKVKEAMLSSIEMDDVCACDLNADYNFTDPETHRYRYQAVFEIVHY